MLASLLLIVALPAPAGSGGGGISVVYSSFTLGAGRPAATQIWHRRFHRGHSLVGPRFGPRYFPSPYPFFPRPYLFRPYRPICWRYQDPFYSPTECFTRRYW